MSQNNTIHIIGVGINSDGNLPGVVPVVSVYELAVFETGVYE